MSEFEVDSIEHFLAVALGAEREALKLYAGLAEQMRVGGNDEMADVFSGIAEEERQHVQEIERIVKKLRIENLPAAPEIAWRQPRKRDDQDLASNPHLATPYIALAYAVNNEEQAFRFYSYIAANAKDEQVRRFAEAFANEELAHAALFREQRRRAYHNRAAQGGDSAAADPGRIQFVAELLAASITIEQDIHHKLIAAHGGDLDLTGHIEQSNALIAKLVKKLGRHLSVAESTLEFDPDDGEGTSTATDDQDPIRSLTISVERAFQFYDSVTAASQNEDTMLQAQELAQAATSRMDALQETLGACRT